MEPEPPERTEASELAAVLLTALELTWPAAVVVAQLVPAEVPAAPELALALAQVAV